jgi:hypothetical protein
MGDAFEVGYLKERFLKSPIRVAEVRAARSEQKAKSEEKALAAVAANRYRQKLKNR